MFSILCVEFYRGSVDRSCEEILEKPVNRISSKTSRRYQIDSRIGIRNANPSSPGPSDYRGPFSRRARLEPRIDGDLSECFRETRLDSPTFPVSLFTPHREMYTNELVINFSMADGRGCEATGGAHESGSRSSGTIDASRRDSQSEFPGYFAT